MKKITALLFAILLAAGTNLFAADYSGGSGTSGDPYQIATTADLIELSKTSNSGDWDKYFIQTAHISFNSDEQQVDWDGDGTADWDANDQLGFSPIGISTNKFTGSYDGDGHTISNLFIDRDATEYIGLFGYIEGDASTTEVQELGLLNVDITGGERVGGLVGYSNNYSDINTCYSTGSVTSRLIVGGIAGEIDDNCVISFSYSTCSVSSTQNGYVGGIAGEIKNNCVISFSYSTGNVEGYANVGGFVGYCYFSSISGCYSTGNVNSSDDGYYVGGFVGYDESSDILKNYSTGNVTGGISVVGGFIGFCSGGTLDANYWKTDGGSLEDTGNDGDIANITESSDGDMKDQSHFTGWDFSGDAETDWVMSSTITYGGYPTLRWTGGYFDEPTSNQIASLPNLVWVTENSGRWATDYTQTADINMWTVPSWDGNQGWTPIGNLTTEFTGSYNGDGHTISNLFINRGTTYSIGLFGNIYGDASTTEVQNLGLLNVNIYGYKYVGGLVGYNQNNSTISNCYSTGSVSGDSWVGGLVGYNISSSTISGSYSTANVSGKFDSGGLNGRNSSASIISNSYSTGSVTRISGSSDTDFGGFCGNDFISTIEYCYSTGSVTYTGFGVQNDKGFVGGVSSSSISNCFWDKETSGSSTSAGTATAKTTSEMKTQSTFTNWDFTSGTGDWNIQSGSYISYPYIQDIAYDDPGENTLGNPIPGLEQKYSGGSGTVGDPYQIANLDDLSELCQTTSDWDKHFIQTANIDASQTQYWDDADDDSDGDLYNDADDATDSGNDEGFSPIGNSTTQFTGSYDGDEYTISNLFINRPTTDYVGLFGRTNGATIEYIGLLNVNISGAYYVGGLVGYNYLCNISNSYAMGDLSGTSRVGGLVGQNSGNDPNFSTISNSYATGDVSGSSIAGGLVGYCYDYSTINNSYATGDVSGTANLGGLVGLNESANIYNSYSTGDVTRLSGTSTNIAAFCGDPGDWEISKCFSTGSVFYTGDNDPTDKGFLGSDGSNPNNVDNFFDSEASNQTSGYDATAKTTSEMKTQSTFTNWDFTADPDKDWNIQSGTYISYPYIQGIAYDTPGATPEVNPIPGLEQKYYYKSDSDGGDWDGPTTWTRSSTEAGSYEATDEAPTNSNSVQVTVINGATVSIPNALSVEIYNLIVISGSTLELNTGGTLTISDGTGTDFTVNGSLDMDGGSFLLASGAELSYGSSSTLIYSDSDAAQTTGAELPSSGIANMTVINPNGVTLGGNVDLAGNLTIESGASLNTDEENGYSINIAGDWTNLGTFIANESTVTFDGASAQTMSGTNTFYNLAISNTHASEKVTTSGTLAVTNNLSITDGIFVSASDYNNVSISSGGTLELSDDITVSGNWTNSGTFTHGGNTVTFDGGNAQTVTGNTSFSGLELSTGTVLTTSDNITVSDVTSGDGTVNASGGTFTFERAGNQNIFSGTYNTITLTGTGTKSFTGTTTAKGGITVNGSMTVEGDGISTTTVQADATQNTASNRVFTVETGNTVTIQDMTVQYGKTADYGGGIKNAGILTLNSVTVADNNVTSSSNTLRGGGIYNSGTLEVNNSTVSSNSLQATGNNESNGGGIYTEGDLTVNYSTISDNENSSDTYTYAGGIEVAGGAFTLNNSTVSGNIADGREFAYGGGISIVNDATHSISNSTISGNTVTAIIGGDKYGAGIVQEYGSLTIRNTVIAGNANSSADYDYSLFDGTVIDGGYNVVGYQYDSNNFDSETSILFNYTSSGEESSEWTQNDVALSNQNLNLSTTLADNNTQNGTYTLSPQWTAVSPLERYRTPPAPTGVGTAP
jgi:hypothetical protein